jgi:hypothetical protein
MTMSGVIISIPNIERKLARPEMDDRSFVNTPLRTGTVRR